ncbi:Methyltransferase [Lachnellula suecica]|uniref:Methyltransferase n=1 Tax=Lachnellula suecica TaxID=602035 RepID=A0A8T9C7D7_9HELO|nr:Methyltransferase [Lachnellula suecica]
MQCSWVLVVGFYSFLQETAHQYPTLKENFEFIYPTILSRLQKGDTLLDIGCFLGHDLRRAVFDGAPSDKLYGVDVVDHWTLGYEFFRDSGRFSAKFIECDVLTPNNELQSLYGKIDIICVTSLLHQWEWEGQVVAAKQLVSFSRPGTIVTGHQIGTSDGASKEKSGKDTSFSWMRQDPKTWAEMWDEVGKATGTEWKSDAHLRTFEERGLDKESLTYLGEHARLLEFVVYRIR